jgi:UDP-N-acetylmuramate dehydrogenase
MLKLSQPFSGLDRVVEQNVPLARHTWYRIGGLARWFIRPRSVEDLQQAAQRCAEFNIRTYVLGLGANILVSDGGVDGAVFRFDAE